MADRTERAAGPQTPPQQSPTEHANTGRKLLRQPSRAKIHELLGERIALEIEGQAADLQAQIRDRSNRALAISRAELDDPLARIDPTQPLAPQLERTEGQDRTGQTVTLRDQITRIRALERTWEARERSQARQAVMQTMKEQRGYVPDPVQELQPLGSDIVTAISRRASELSHAHQLSRNEQDDQEVAQGDREALKAFEQVRAKAAQVRDLNSRVIAKQSELGNAEQHQAELERDQPSLTESQTKDARESIDTVRQERNDLIKQEEINRAAGRSMARMNPELVAAGAERARETAIRQKIQDNTLARQQEHHTPAAHEPARSHTPEARHALAQAPTSRTPDAGIGM